MAIKQIEKEVSCPSCNGSGKREEHCTACGGRMSSDYHSCYACGGRGRVDKPCGACGGSGRQKSTEWVTVNDDGSTSSSGSSSSSSSSSGSSSYSGGGNSAIDRMRQRVRSAAQMSMAGDLDGAIAANTSIIEECEPLRSYNTNFGDQMRFAYYNRGVAYLKKSNWDNAIADFTKGYSAYGVDGATALSEAYKHRGDSYEEKGEYDKAIADYTSAIKEKRDYHSAYCNRGYAYSKKGNKEQATVDYKTAANWGSQQALTNLKNWGINYTPVTPPEIIQDRIDAENRRKQKEIEDKKNRRIETFSPIRIVDRDSGEGSTFIMGVLVALIGLVAGSHIGGAIAGIVAAIIGWVIGSQVIGKSIHIRLGKVAMYIGIVIALIIGGIILFGTIGTIFERPSRSQPERTTTQAAPTATITSNVNFRSGPSTNDEIIRQLQEGSTVTLTGQTSGGWTEITHNGDTGWVSAQFLNTPAAASSSAASGQQAAAPAPTAQTQTPAPAAQAASAPEVTQAPTGSIAEWARGNYSDGIVLDANSITNGRNINISGVRTVEQQPLSGHPNLKWAYIYAGDRKYGVVWDRTTYSGSWHEGIELGMGNQARSAFDFYNGSDKDSIFADIFREAPGIKVVK